ncbi:Ig-like domain-containing protein [Erysipelothrix anatis]|uniref:Ig-like domain-containing protein n=1 Tax=Erysipelothrix anatis TaxID=2683713 RepID=UPI0013577070|nr:Ig-like domain-containing protein [Erysipelothrix anatis]
MKRLRLRNTLGIFLIVSLIVPTVVPHTFKVHAEVSDDTAATDPKENLTDPIIVNETQLTLEQFQATTITYSIVDNKEAQVTFSTADANIATIDSKGFVSAKNPGTTTVSIYAVIEGERYQKDILVTVKPVGGSVTFAHNEISLNRGSSYALEYTLSDPNLNQSAIVWSSTNSAVATVENGTVTGHSIGETIISASIGDQVASVKVNVVVPLESITFNPESLSIIEGNSKDLPGLIYVPYDTSTKRHVEYSVKDPSIVQIEESMIVGLNVGKTTITATVNGISTVLAVEVTPKQTETGAEMITLSELGVTNDTITVGLQKNQISDKMKQSLTISEDIIVKAIAGKQKIVVQLPRQYFEKNMSRIDAIKVPEGSLATLSDTPLIVELQAGEQKRTVAEYTFSKPLTKDYNMRFAIDPLSDTSPLREHVHGKAFDIRFPKNLDVSGVKVTFPAKIFESSDSQIHFVYTVSGSELGSNPQTVTTADKKVTIAPLDSRLVLSFNKASKTSDMTVIWILGSIVLLLGAGFGVFYFNRYQKQKKI